VFTTFKNAWKIPELRKKIMFTLIVIVAYRFGCTIPVPFLDPTKLKELMDTLNTEGSALGNINMLTGESFSKATIFALGITPYINSSIIMNLLTVAIPPLERLSKEGETGRKKITEITRYVTVGLGLMLSIAYYFFLKNSGIVNYQAGFSGVFAAIVIIFTFTAGTALIMWMGEQINEKGIGNGISVILFAGIVARLPVIVGNIIEHVRTGASDPANSYMIPFSLFFIVLFLAIVWLIVFMNEAERRVPIQYAKKVVGRKMYGGQSSFLPIKVAMSGVMPVIFAGSILSIPSIVKLFYNPAPGSFWAGVFNTLQSGGFTYCVLYFLLILMFAYFYMSIQYNPLEMANNLRQNNGTIPGIRPGRPTAEFISKILSKITLIGALFLAFIAILPIVYGNISRLQTLSFGGTSIIILVGVALETVKQLESQMMMRHYKGFLD
jgi:preprotein translocase, SecY subunit